MRTVLGLFNHVHDFCNKIIVNNHLKPPICRRLDSTALFSIFDKSKVNIPFISFPLVWSLSLFCAAIPMIMRPLKNDKNRYTVGLEANRFCDQINSVFAGKLAP